MKLVRYGAAGKEKPGIIDKNGKIRDLSKIVKDIDGEALSPASLAKIKKANIDKLPLVKGNPRLGSCVAKPVELHRHRAELRRPRRRSRHEDPAGADHLQQGAELHLRPERQHHHPEGLEQARLGDRARHRDRQPRPLPLEGKGDERRSPATACRTTCPSACSRSSAPASGPRARAARRFGPLGPWMVTKDEIKDPQNLNMELTVNGEVRQKGNTKTMIFGVAHLVWACSQYFILEPGDVIITGTPPGVGLGMKPEPKFLNAGDVVRLKMDGLGTQTQKIVKGRY